MSQSSDGQILRPDAEELLLCSYEACTCETYIFEPSPEEKEYGYLFAAGETENRAGIGKELLDTVISAIQKEYYRDTHRSPSTSFEMALHQANLILHDASEQGIRDWMGYFHVAVGILVKNTLHICVAGEGHVLIVRNRHITDISEGISHLPITNPLQTFSQVASGEISAGDTVFLTSSAFPSLFPEQHITRALLQGSGVAPYLESLYKDQGSHNPLAALAVSIKSQYSAASSQAAAFSPISRPGNPSGIARESIQPRKPLIIRRSTIQSALVLIATISKTSWRFFMTRIWPYVMHGSKRGGKAVIQASRATGRNIQSLATRNKDTISFTAPSLSVSSAKSTSQQVLGIIRNLPQIVLAWFGRLPKTSRIFAIFSLLLVLALGASLLLLQQKRSSDEDIQRASEILHEAETKKSAAETALIYDNRDQARGLLSEAEQLSKQLIESGLYQEEAQKLQTDIQDQMDRLQRISRAKSSEVRLVGDTGSLITGKTPTTLFFVQDSLYTVNPDNNSIVKVPLSGTPDVVHQTSEGIGYITGGTPQEADKTIIFETSPAGVAIFDTKDTTLLGQTISFPIDDPKLQGVAAFGNRLYVYDTTSKQIYSYNKTLRGFSNGSAWITSADFPKDTIKDIAVDGNIFTLHTDGTIRRLFKGETSAFEQEKVEPSLQTAERIITSDDLNNIYVVDPTNKRIVIYSKKGVLVQQLYIEVEEPIADIAVHPEEKSIYLLAGTKVVEVTLDSPTAATPAP